MALKSRGKIKDWSYIVGIVLGQVIRGRQETITMDSHTSSLTVMFCLGQATSHDILQVPLLLSFAQGDKYYQTRQVAVCGSYLWIGNKRQENNITDSGLSCTCVHVFVCVHACDYHESDIRRSRMILWHQLDYR